MGLRSDESDSDDKTVWLDYHNAEVKKRDQRIAELEEAARLMESSRAKKRELFMSLANRAGDVPTSALVAAEMSPPSLDALIDALIKIAAGFREDVYYTKEDSFCLHCRCHMQNGCLDDCPGLLARQALGVA